MRRNASARWPVSLPAIRSSRSLISIDRIQGASRRRFRCAGLAEMAKLEFGSRARFAEQIALGQVYARRAQRRALLFRLNSLRRDRDFENPADRQDSRYDGRAFRTLRHVPDE